MKRKSFTSFPLSSNYGPTTSARPIDDPDRLLRVEEAVELCGYRGRKRFLAMARSTGLELIYINSRVIRIRRGALREWEERRAV